MAKRSRAKYRVGPDVRSDEVLRDRKGRVIDDRYVEGAVSDALRKARARGRPSLSEAGESPLLRVRLPQELDDAVRKAAERTGKSRAEWVREVLARATRRAG
jgi:predicted HicB family RNase H-like nuclease